MGKRLEKKVFKKPVGEVWAETVRYYTQRLRDPAMVERAENKDPKLKMSMVFRWYLSKSSGWANRGEGGRQMDYQVWCGPAIGAFNDFIAGSFLDPSVANAFPCVVQTNLHLLRGACFELRLQHVAARPPLHIAIGCSEAMAPYFPQTQL